MKKPFNIRTYGFGLVLACQQNNLSHTWYVRALNGRSILYLNWDKFLNLNFQVRIKSQNLKIEAFWEITRVRNSISKVRTCKHKQWNFDCFNGICILTDFFLDAMDSMAQQQKGGPQRSSKSNDKAPLSFLIFRIIDHDWWSNE